MIDARGRSCPEPVVMIKKAMISNEDNYEIVVDSKVSVENITRFVQHNGYQAEVVENDSDYVLKIKRK